MLHHYIAKENARLTVNVKEGVDIQFENFVLLLNDEIEEDIEKIAYMDGPFVKKTGLTLVQKVDMEAAAKRATESIALKAKTPQASKGGFTTSAGHNQERAAVSAEMNNPTVIG